MYDSEESERCQVMIGRMPRSTHPYHHGALREALIEATEVLLTERGAEGFSLREVARRAGVSPAAPAHHFGDAAGKGFIHSFAGMVLFMTGLALMVLADRVLRVAFVGKNQRA